MAKAPNHRVNAPEDVGQFDIKPGETKKKDGSRDVVLEESMESFPASDPPARTPVTGPGKKS